MTEWVIFYKIILMKTENELHKAVVKYIRNNLPKFIILIPGLGEFQRNEILKRSAYLEGYRPGSPDLIISTPNGEYNGLAIEFKTPVKKNSFYGIIKGSS